MLYPLDKVPETLRDVLLLNPLAPLFELARKWIIDPTAPGPAEAAGSFARAAAGARDLRGASASLAVWLFNREAPRIAEEL